MTVIFTRIDDVPLGVGTGVDVAEETGKDVDSSRNERRREPRDVCTTHSIPRPKLLEYRIILKNRNE